MQNNKMLRVINLFRVSTKGQVDRETLDIPAQRNILHDWEKQQENWEVVEEFIEAGVSGYKNSQNERDAIVKIRYLAQKNEFDILAVYHSDRLGRKAEDTPILISYLNQLGKKVISYCEGELKVETHTDKLITYIRCWQNEGESIKNAIRVTDYHIEATKSGKYRGGGMIPFGYMLVNNNRLNSKGRSVLDYKVNVEEAQVVKEIFELSLKYNCGASRIAKHLNEKGYKTRKGGKWQSSTIMGIFRNPIYKGQFHMFSNYYHKTVLSPIIKEIVIIDENEWDKNSCLIQSRSNKINKSHTDIDAPQNKVSYGKLLLSGLLYCGYCNSRITTMTAYRSWILKDGTTKKEKYYKYRCSSFLNGGICNGKSTYGIKKIEDTVLRCVSRYISDVLDKYDDEKFQNILNNTKISLMNDLQKIDNQIAEKKQELTLLLRESSKALAGRSVFTCEQVLNVYTVNENELKDINIQREHLVQRMEQIELVLKQNKEYKMSFFDWQKRFGKQDYEGKKALLRNIVNKGFIYKDYIEIAFSINPFIPDSNDDKGAIVVYREEMGKSCNYEMST